MLFYALYATVNVYFMSTMSSTNPSISMVPLLIFTGISVVVWYFVVSFNFGTLFSIFNKYKENGYIPAMNFKTFKKDVFHYSWRNLKAYLWITPYWLIITIGIILFAYTLSYELGTHNTTFTKYLIALFVFVVVLLFYIPMIFVYIRYMMSGEGFLKSFPKTFKIALRHWGIIFALAVITYIVIFVISTILSMPECVIFIVKRMSVTSIDFGDTAGLPRGFDTLSLFVIFLCSFLQVYVGQFFYFPMLFQYASIESDVQERQELAKLNAKEDYDTMTSLTNKKKNEEENFIYRS
jgi:hypothetical protein